MGPMPSPVPARPRVQQDHRAVAVRADTFDRVVRDHRRRCDAPPSPRAPRANARCGSRARPSTPNTRSSSAPAPNGHRNHGRGSLPVADCDHGLRVEHVAPQPLVVQERHPRVVVRVVSDQVALVGDPSRPSPGCDSAHRPCTKNVARTPASPSVSRMCSALRGGHHGRSGCSASNVNATRRRAPSLTCRHLRRADVGAGRAAAFDRELPREELRGQDGHGGREQPVLRADVDPHHALGGLSAFDDGDRGALPARPARPRARRRGRASRARWR